MSLIDDLQAKLEDAQRLAAEIKAQDSITVKAGDNLQALLDAGGNLVGEPGAVFSASRFVFNKSVHLSGDIKLIGTAGPAVHVTPGANGIILNDFECSAPGYGDCIQLGNNDSSQTSLDQVPRNIELNRVKVLSHDRKRALAINSTLTRIIDCDFLDCWDRSGATQDSQPWAIMNSPGEIFIQGGNHSGGSELGMIGGDTMKIIDNGKLIEPRNIFIGGTPEKNLVLFRPLEWMNELKPDGTKVNRAVKCGLELKTGHNVLLKYATIRGCWKFGQPDAFAIQLTPKSGGAITNFVAEDIIVEDSASFMGITAFDYSPAMNPIRTTGIVVNRAKVTLDRVKYLGTGRLFLLQGGIGTLDVDNLEFTNPAGNAFISTDKVKTERISIKNSKGNLAKYRFFLGGYVDGVNWPTYVDTLTVEGNTFSEATNAFKAALPNNTYI